MDRSIKKRIPNVHPDTDVPYGVIALNKLDQDVVDALQYGPQATNLTYEAAKAEYIKQKRAEYDACLISSDDPEFDEFFEGTEFHNQYEGADEESHAGEYEGIQYQTFWLGGAPMLWVFKSPFVRGCRPCSPCVPNAADLDTEGTYIGYDVPPGWRAA